VDELVHAAGAERGAHGVGDGRAGADVAEHLPAALRGVRALLEEDDLRLLRETRTPRSESSAGLLARSREGEEARRGWIGRSGGSGAYHHRRHGWRRRGGGRGSGGAVRRRVWSEGLAAR
jgi:hypothetical protein